MKFNKYFDSKEFDSPDVEGSGEKMELYFIKKLTIAREANNKPMLITSGYRTKKHNIAVGGKENSAHLRGYASDIAVFNSNDRYRMVRALMLAGFKRIGVANGFIHCDCDPSLPQNVLWKY